MSRKINFRVWNPSQELLTTVRKKDYMSFNGIVYDEIGCNNSDNIWMQYTGLKDKNGVEIYEGDILKSESEYLEVEYCVQNSSFRILTRKVFSNHKTNDVRYSFPENLGNGYYSRKDLEVIGNIHQNPELL